ncbi:response regulator [Pseudobacteriovorax antillogorgiicola]|uniref:Response regulator receiver domain-containing protein n=1 Tax=Pseudobacteriovorax antillogorgiicola TaxID=1513793 RepID=A0A1Y6CR75_9BACT|nr:response regulator [Pseudobacteriovorax antillogorgiicola]TCS42211.1 response regulator receiver domain-containing protein [Pseudobacteriovorax antillogorgiicola]SMF82815.1 Response regulator receiver domain-containing protein [Pseudobacteriovorax antillogorgiicola]
MTKSIMVVDDDPDILDILTSFIRLAGYTPLPFSDPEEAVLNYDQQNVDLIVTDYIMPKMNGEQMINQIFESNNEVPVIMITGFEEELILESDSSKSIIVVGKPFENDSLGELINAQFSA